MKKTEETEKSIRSDIAAVDSGAGPLDPWSQIASQVGVVAGGPTVFPSDSSAEVVSARPRKLGKKVENEETTAEPRGRRTPETHQNQGRDRKPIESLFDEKPSRESEESLALRKLIDSKDIGIDDEAKLLTSLFNGGDEAPPARKTPAATRQGRAADKPTSPAPPVQSAPSVQPVRPRGQQDNRRDPLSEFPRNDTKAKDHWSDRKEGMSVPEFRDRRGPHSERPQPVDRELPVERERSVPRERPVDRERSVPRERPVERERSVPRERPVDRERSVPRERPVDRERSVDRDKPVLRSPQPPQDDIFHEGALWDIEEESGVVERGPRRRKPVERVSEAAPSGPDWQEFSLDEVPALDPAIKSVPTWDDAISTIINANMARRDHRPTGPKKGRR